MFFKKFHIIIPKLTNKNEKKKWCKELFKLSKGEEEETITKIKLKRKVKLEM